MPVLISNQTTNTNNNEQQEQIYEQDEDRQINHVSNTEPEVRQLFLFPLLLFFYLG
jgi:hypothetical protein